MVGQCSVRVGDRVGLTVVEVTTMHELPARGPEVSKKWSVSVSQSMETGPKPLDSSRIRQVRCGPTVWTLESEPLRYGTRPIDGHRSLWKRDMNNYSTVQSDCMQRRRWLPIESYIWSFHLDGGFWNLHPPVPGQL
jgi:hypothetical protein